MIQNRDLGDENDEIFLDFERISNMAVLSYYRNYFDRKLKEIHDEYKKCVNTQSNTESASHQHYDPPIGHPI